MRLFATLSLLFTATIICAQTLWPYPPSKLPNVFQEQDPNGQLKELELIQPEQRSSVELWGEDFELGLNDWVSETTFGNVEWVLTATGNTAGFSPGPLESSTGFPTGSWMTADSDAQGSAGTYENSTLTSPPITSLAQYPTLLLEFEQSFRQLNDDETTVEISPDGGSSWVEFPVNTNIVGNQSTPGAPTSQSISINVSSALNGGSNNILIRFRWESFEGFTYAWNVDDIKLSEALANDIGINEITYSEWFFDQANDFSTLAYSIYPVDQIRPLTFKSVVTNNGINLQTGVHLQIEVDGPGSNDLNAGSTSVELLSGGTDSLIVSGYTPPSVPGSYALQFEVLQDQIDDNPNSNTATTSFQISQHEFARDRGNLNGVYDNQGGGFELGNWYGITNTGSTLYSIDVALSSTTDPGALIVGVLYDSNRDYISETIEYVVQSSDLNEAGENNFIILPMIDPELLQAGEDYLIVIKHYGGANNVVVGTSGISPEQSSLIFDEPVNIWFFVTSTPMVRMGLDPTVGIEDALEMQEADLQAYPNPARNSTQLQFDLKGAADVQFEILDAMGRTIRRTKLGKLAPGAQKIQIDRQTLPSGMYSIVLFTNNQRSVQRIIFE